MTRDKCNLELAAVMSGVTAPAGRRPLANALPGYSLGRPIVRTLDLGWPRGARSIGLWAKESDGHFLGGAQVRAGVCTKKPGTGDRCVRA